jgi:hypothetical protein
MSGVRVTKNEPPLEALLERLNELTRQLPRSDRLRSIAEPTLATQSQPTDSTERAALADLMAAVKRAEVAQAQRPAELRPEIIQAIERMASAVQQGVMLSDDAIQKLRVALGGTTLGNAERRIQAELTEIKASLAYHATNQSRARVLVAAGLGVILFAAGVAAGVLIVPYLALIVPYLNTMFQARLR